MNSPIPSGTEAGLTRNARLLEAIRAIRESVGDGLNDDEFTRLLRQSGLPSEAGFCFLSYCNGCVTLSVPPQDHGRWYPEKGWIAPDKERLARAIAEKHQLSLYEPPDVVSSCLYPLDSPPERPHPHHHLELSNRRETMVVAHPHYLKIRLFGLTPGSRYVVDAKGPLLLGPELLQDLSALYQA